MGRTRLLIVAAVVAAGLAACGPGAATPSAPPTVPAASPTSAPATSGSLDPAGTAALAFLEALASGDLATAEAMEDSTMRAAAPAAALGELWAQLEAQFGAFGSFGPVSMADAAPYTNATVPGSFANAVVPLIVTVDAEGRVAGLHLGAPEPAGSGAPSPSPASSPAAYVDPAAFTETEVTVGSAPWQLPGTLSTPVGDGPYPAVVLLAGSGPNDRDETVGPNAPLRDIAQGLASNGIAVLRYDKRTNVHGAAMDPATVTVREETVDDAVAAVDLLRATAGVDPARVLVVGHSLGGYLAPRVAAAAPGRVAAIGLLEANSSPLPRLLVAQYEHLASEAGGADPQAAAALPTVREQVARAESPSLSPSTPASELPLGIPAGYWLDLRAYDPLETIAGLSIPVFVAQGGRDYQVPPSELEAWRTALAGRPDATIREYPALNHLLLEGTGPSRPAEYALPGHVSGELVSDLAAWVLATDE